MTETLMSIFQNADWATIPGSVISFVAIVAIVMEHRRLSVLKREVLRLSLDVKDLASANQRRFLRELKSASKDNEKVVHESGPKELEGSST